MPSEPVKSDSEEEEGKKQKLKKLDHYNIYNNPKKITTIKDKLHLL